MARVPPVSAPPGSKYITPEGARRLREELERLFPEDIDRNDPWQFKNVRVIW